MDHVVYVDSKDNELEKLMDGRKTMIIRGAAGRKLPHGRVQAGDVLYFIRNNGEGLVKARACVRQALHSEKLSEAESVKLIAENQTALQLGEAQQKRWSGKRFLVLVEVGPVETVEPFAIDRSAYGNMDDWLIVGEVAGVRMLPV